MTAVSTIMTADWIIHVRFTNDFKRSSPQHLCGVKYVAPGVKSFSSTVKEGDRLWFKEKGGIVFAVATFMSIRPRELGPLISVTLPDEELGWEGGSECDMEIRYTDLFIILRKSIIITDKSATTVKRYTDECNVNLPQEYTSLSKYAPNKFDVIPPYCLPPRVLITDGCIARKEGDAYLSGVGGLTLYKSIRCGKVCSPGLDLCKGCHMIEAIFKKTGDPATGKSKHHDRWFGLMTEAPPSWAHIEGTQWHRANS